MLALNTIDRGDFVSPLPRTGLDQSWYSGEDCLVRGVVLGQELGVIDQVANGWE